MNEKYRILSTISLYHAVTDGPLAVISILYPFFKTLFHLTYTQVGVITGGGLFVTLISQLLIGRIADGKNSRILLSFGVFLTSVSLLFLTQSYDFLTLIIFIFFLRFSTSFFHPIGIGWVSRIFKKDRLDWAMGIQSGAANFSSFVAVATTLTLTQLYTIAFPLYLWFILGMICLVFCLTLTRTISSNNAKIPIVKKKSTIKEAFTEHVHLLYRIRRIIPAFMISGFAWGLIISYFPLLLQEKTTISLSIIGLIVAVWIGIGGVAAIFYGKLTSILGRRNVIISSYLIMGLSCICLAIFTHLMIILGIMVLLGVSVFLTYPALFSFVSEITHESVESRTFGITFTLQTGGGALGLFFSGVLSDIYSIELPFILLGVFSLLSTLLLLYKHNTPLISPE